MQHAQGICSVVYYSELTVCWAAHLQTDEGHHVEASINDLRACHDLAATVAVWEFGRTTIHQHRKDWLFIATLTYIPFLNQIVEDPAVKQQLGTCSAPTAVCRQLCRDCDRYSSYRIITHVADLHNCMPWHRCQRHVSQHE